MQIIQSQIQNKKIPRKSYEYQCKTMWYIIPLNWYILDTFLAQHCVVPLWNAYTMYFLPIEECFQILSMFSGLLGFFFTFLLGICTSLLASQVSSGPQDVELDKEHMHRGNFVDPWLLHPTVTTLCGCYQQQQLQPQQMQPSLAEAL